MNSCNCSGTGAVEKDGILYECVCAYIRRRASDMPAYIRRSEVLEAHLRLPILNLVNSSAFVLSSWADMRSVIKIVMIRNPNLFLRITSDREILDVFLGKSSRAAKGSDEEVAFNSLQDLVDSPGLVVIRLNELSYKNKAVSGALEESICFRLDRDKPVWVVSNVDKPFTVGSPAWSDSVSDIMKTQMKFSSVERILIPKSMLEDPGMSPEPVQSVKQEIPASRSEKPIREKSSVTSSHKSPRERSKIQSVPDDVEFDPMSMYGSGVSTSKKSFKRD